MLPTLLHSGIPSCSPLWQSSRNLRQALTMKNLGKMPKEQSTCSTTSNSARQLRLTVSGSLVVWVGSMNSLARCSTVPKGCKVTWCTLSCLFKSSAPSMLSLWSRKEIKTKMATLPKNRSWLLTNISFTDWHRIICSLKELACTLMQFEWKQS